MLCSGHPFRGSPSPVPSGGLSTPRESETQSRSNVKRRTPLGSRELGRELGDVVGGEHEERLAGVVGHVGQQRAELAGGDAAVGLAAGLDAGGHLLDLVEERDVPRRRRELAERLPGLPLGLADEAPLEAAEVDEDGGAADLVAEAFGELGLAGPRYAEDQDPAGLGPARVAPQGAEAERL